MKIINNDEPKYMPTYSSFLVCLKDWHPELINGLALGEMHLEKGSVDPFHRAKIDAPEIVPAPPCLFSINTQHSK